jgi:major membrane immunogen (membrane-anchored lipoprotein)
MLEKGCMAEEVFDPEVSEKNNNKKQLFLAVGFLAVLLLVLLLSQSPKKNVENSLSSDQVLAPTTVLTESVTSGNYQNGQYQAVGKYLSPGGEESIQVELTLQDGKVVAAQAKSLATLPTSQEFQKQFVENFQPQVLGKNINELSLDKVAGSSLTPKGFNNAVEQIKEQAKG